MLMTGGAQEAVMDHLLVTGMALMASQPAVLLPSLDLCQGFYSKCPGVLLGWT